MFSKAEVMYFRYIPTHPSFFSSEVKAKGHSTGSALLDPQMCPSQIKERRQFGWRRNHHRKV